jgi:hypothetical protein
MRLERNRIEKNSVKDEGPTISKSNEDNQPSLKFDSMPRATIGLQWVWISAEE